MKLNLFKNKKNTAVRLKVKNNQKGQALLFVVITMTIALALGIGLSLETINTVANVSNTDTSQRALAAAEGAAERVLTLDNGVLANLADGITQLECEDPNTVDGEYVDSECFVRFPAAGGDNVEIRASVLVSEYEVVDDGNYSSPIDILENQVDEVFLEGASFPATSNGEIEVCWNGNSILYYRVYNASGDSINEIVECSAGNCVSGWSVNNSVVAQTGSSVSRPAYDNCYTIETLAVSDPRGLRMRALGGPIIGEMFPTPTLPAQGYKIATEGELVDLDDITRQVTVFKTFSYAPAIFDFSFYSKDNLAL